MSEQIDRALRDYAVAIDESAPTVRELIPAGATGSRTVPTVVDIEVVRGSRPTAVRSSTSATRWMAVAAAVVATVLVPTLWFVVGRDRPDAPADGEVAASSVSQSEVPATTGVMTITADTVLSADHEGYVVIDADDVTLDCGGRTIVGTEPSSPNPRGIVVRGRTGVTVTRCRLVEAEVLIEGTRAGTFEDIATDGRGAGFDLVDAHDNLFVDNVVTGGNSFGLNASTGNTFLRNTVAGAGTGFNVFLGSVGNTFTGNVVRDSVQGFADDSTGGSGTEGTGNVYTGNRCIADDVASVPAGLCD